MLVVYLYAHISISYPSVYTGTRLNCSVELSIAHQIKDFVINRIIDHNVYQNDFHYRSLGIQSKAAIIRRNIIKFYDSTMNFYDQTNIELAARRE